MNMFMETSESLIVGIDEAGRGAQLGPLVLAAAATTPDRLRRLRACGIFDPKALSRARREALATRVRKHLVWFDVEIAPAARVDLYVRSGRTGGAATLNTLEQEMAEALLARAPATRLQPDTGMPLPSPRARGSRQLSLSLPPQVVADGRVLFSPLQKRVPLLQALDHADTAHPLVAAAALLAKLERDRLLDELDATVSSLVGRIPRRGYPGPETTAWLSAYAAFFQQAAPEQRLTWYRKEEVQHALPIT